MIDTSFAPEFNRCKFSCFGRSVKLKGHKELLPFSPQNLPYCCQMSWKKSTPCDRSVPKSSISVEEYIPGAGKKKHTT